MNEDISGITYKIIQPKQILGGSYQSKRPTSILLPTIIYNRSDKRNNLGFRLRITYREK